MSAPLELRYHSAMPGWCRVVGLKIKAVHECEGGGFCIAEDQAKLIVAAPDLLAACKTAIAVIKGREHTGFLEAVIAKAEAAQ